MGASRRQRILEGKEHYAQLRGRLPAAPLLLPMHHRIDVSQEDCTAL